MSHSQSQPLQMSNVIWSEEPVHIPPKDKPNLELIDVTVARINSKNATRVMSILSMQAPLSKYRHLKRVRKVERQVLEVIICTLDQDSGGGWPPINSENENAKEIPAQLLEKLQGYMLSMSTIGVPKHAPEDIEQCREWNAFWPLTFKIMPGKVSTRSAEIVLSELEKKNMKMGLEKAWEAAARCSQNNGICNGAVIVDPSCNRVLSVGLDERAGSEGLHPLRHASIVAIEAVAAKTVQFYANAGSKKRNFDMLAEDTLERDSNANGADTPRTENSPGPYLCTGYDCFLVQEPCTMCAMALVHSRIRRIVYCIKDPKHGALGGAYRLHGTSGLNHHYEVFHWQAQMKDGS